MNMSPRRDRIALVLIQPGQPDGEAAVLPYLQAVLAAADQGVPSLARRLVQKAQARRLARHFRPDILLDGPGELPGDILEAALWELGTLQVFGAGLFTGPSMTLVARDVAAFAPDRIVVVPPSALFSGGLNGLARLRWDLAAKDAGLTAPTSHVCCHPTDAAILRPLAGQVAAALTGTGQGAVRTTLVMMVPGTGWSGGDPLAWQLWQLVSQLTQLIDLGSHRIEVAQLPVSGFESDGLPAVDRVLRRIRVPRVVLLPLFPWPLVRASWSDFLSEWRQVAQGAGVMTLDLLAPPACDIAALAPLVRQVLAGRPGVCAGFGRRFCPPEQAHCPHRRMAVAAMHRAGDA